MFRLSDGLKKQINDSYIRRLKQNTIKSAIKIAIIIAPYLLIEIICLLSDLFGSIFLIINDLTSDMLHRLKWWIVK